VQHAECQGRDGNNTCWTCCCMFSNMPAHGLTKFCQKCDTLFGRFAADLQQLK
jgi:hypothetical protein